MAEYRRFAGPAALLVAVTIAVVLIRVFAEHHHSSEPPGATTITVTLKRAATWTVKAGDTLPKIAAATGIPLATIRRLNPDVSATTLYIGEKIHLR